MRLTAEEINRAHEQLEKYYTEDKLESHEETLNVIDAYLASHAYVQDVKSLQRHPSQKAVEALLAASIQLGIQIGENRSV